MSDKKMYALKNDEGKYWDFYYARFWRRTIPGFYATAIKEQVERVADEEGGHVVALIEEPEKVVLTKEQAEIVENARYEDYPASYISEHAGEYEELLMNAYVNGYTLAKEKKYNLVLGTDTDDSTNALFKLNYNPCTDDALGLDSDTYADDLKLDELYQFTQEEIDKYNKDFWIKNIDLNDYKVEVTDDEQ